MTDTTHDLAPPDLPPDAGDGSSRRLLLTPASEIRMRPVRWTWTDRVPAGALTVIPGREGIGKSLTLAWLTAQITRGTLPGIWHGTPRAVIYAATEDSWSHTIGPRLYAAGADLTMVYRVDVQHDGGFDALTLPRDCRALAVEIERLGVALLAADPLLSLIHASIDTHRDRDLRTALEPLVNMADRTGCAVVGLAHFNKSASADALNLITGSRAFSAVARAVIAIARDDEAGDGSCVMSQAKNNLGRLDLPSLRYLVESVEIPTEEGPAYVGKLTITGESDRSVADILGDNASDGDGGSSRADREAVADWLRDYLTDHGGEAPWDDIRKAARAAGLAERTVQRARTRAKVTVRSIGFPRRSVWTLTVGNDDGATDANGAQSRQSRQDSEAGATGATEARLAPLPDLDDTPSPPTSDAARHNQSPLTLIRADGGTAA
ncbi:AAA domain-containing protein [Krasilnikovia cinnamomea]|uniref:AAA domain-containing protein n=1 Tax=Krasilnikovia cinnamomea TaxID=349313 RepID=A0A4Q7ZLN7_9ACTN|nr:AAA family ATPase [Krasilnikovia cinnamomea]RZU51531.1 AAA domain-containing protein [Krasilnikovia cinnamomea]